MGMVEPTYIVFCRNTHGYILHTTTGRKLGIVSFDGAWLGRILMIDNYLFDLVGLSLTSFF